MLSNPGKNFYGRHLEGPRTDTLGELFTTVSQYYVLMFVTGPLVIEESINKIYFA